MYYSRLHKTAPHRELVLFSVYAHVRRNVFDALLFSLFSSVASSSLSEILNGAKEPEKKVKGKL
jgi:hypothetical protein